MECERRGKPKLNKICGGIPMYNNGFCGGNYCWIIILLILFCGCGNNGMCGGNYNNNHNCGCGCDNNNCCC